MSNTNKTKDQLREQKITLTAPYAPEAGTSNERVTVPRFHPLVEIRD